MSSTQSQNYLSLPLRLLALVLYLVGLFAVSQLVTGEWLPTGARVLWFAAALGLWCLNLMSAPFFQPPRGALANGLASGLLLLTVDLSGVRTLAYELDVFRWTALGLAAVTVVAATVAIALYRANPVERPIAAALGKTGYRISDQFGKGQLVFTPPALIGIIGFYQGELTQQMWLLFLWTLVAATEPIESVILGIRRFKGAMTSRSSGKFIGTIQRVDDPNIVRVTLKSTATWEPDTVHVACLPMVGQRCVVPLFSQVRGQEVLGTGLLCQQESGDLIEVAQAGFVYKPTKPFDRQKLIDEISGKPDGADLVGFIVEDSTISGIRFEVSRKIPLQEGQMVFCRQGDETVYYQILDARTTEESFEQNPRGTHVVTAAQLGVLSEGRAFKKYGWLPPMNGPVFLPRGSVGSHAEVADDNWVLGTVPGSEVEVTVDFKALMEYHTAILGMTGSGKTELVLDVIREALRRDVKVFCVDFTGEYLPRLSDNSPMQLGLSEEQAGDLNTRLFDVETGEFAAGNEKRALKVFVDAMKPVVEEQVRGLLEPNGASVGVFQLDDIANTRATLRATEMYLSTIFKWAREHRKARQILVVLEEAHTVVPEMNLYRYDRVDTEAVVGRISQIALQGRKYGVGLLLVSQRTALVSKTALSQCNTCLTFSLVDRTSLEYLANVHSPEHVRAIPNLKFLEVLASGKAVNCERPIIAQVPYDERKVLACEELNVPFTPAEAPPASESPPMSQEETTEERGNDTPF